jgi:hypothetical protein
LDGGIIAAEKGDNRKMVKTTQKPVNRAKVASTEAHSEPMAPTSPTPVEADESLPQPAADAGIVPVEVAAAVMPNLNDLDGLLARMSPEQIQKIKVLAASKGLTTAVAGIAGGGNKLADGSMTVEIHLDAPMTEQLEIWAEADGLTLVEEAQKRILESLENYLYGDWNPHVEPQPAAAADTTTTDAAAK